MIVSKHAVRRLKDHALVPKTMDGHKARDFVRKYINDHTDHVYFNKKTGARVHITQKFIAIMYGERVVTIYPNTQANREEVLIGGQLREA